MKSKGICMVAAALAALAGCGDGASQPAVGLGPTAGGRAIELLQGEVEFTAVGDPSSLTSIVVGVADLENPAILNAIEDLSARGRTVAVTQANEKAIAALAALVGRKSARPSLGDGESADFVALTTIECGAGRAVPHSVVLFPLDMTTGPGDGDAAGTTALLQQTLIAPSGPCPTGTNPEESSTEITQLTSGTSLSYKKEDSAGDYIVVTGNVLSARSFANQQDVYLFTMQEEYSLVDGTEDCGNTPCPGYVFAGFVQSGVDTSKLSITNESPASTPSETTSVTSTWEWNVGGDTGVSHGEPELLVSGGVSHSTSTTVTVSPSFVDYVGTVTDPSWDYVMGTTPDSPTYKGLANWAFEVPFDAYTESSPTDVTFGMNASSWIHFTPNTTGGSGVLTLAMTAQQVVPLPFGTFTLEPPTVGGVSQGQVKPGELFTITGTNLYIDPNDAQTLLIGGSAVPLANLSPLSPTSLQVDMPDNTVVPAGKNQSVVVKTAEGFSNDSVTITVEKSG